MSCILRNPKVRHRVLLKEMGLNPSKFLVANEDYESYTFIEKNTNRKLCVRY